MISDNVHSDFLPFQLEAAMCYARGNAYLQLREVEKAKQCFKEALQLDVRCYDVSSNSQSSRVSKDC